MADTVVIVESPAKAKTINKYLGSGYEVLASFGHVRDLPSKDGSVDPDHDFAMVWDVDPKSQKRVSDIAKAVKGGIGQMPPFGDKLSEAQIAALAAYVAKATGAVP